MRGALAECRCAAEHGGIDIDHASQVVNLSRLEAEALPVIILSPIAAKA